MASASPAAPEGAPLPPDEEARLAEVRALGLLDTPREERFDRITRTARRIIGTPIALITLVDEHRQWFKSCQGLGLSQTDRSASFCAHAILSDAPFAVADTHLDPVFSGNPLVIGPPYIRAYLGIPLHGPGYHRVGTLCALDVEPRQFTPEDIDALTDLARWVESELGQTQLAEALARQRETEDRLRSVLDSVDALRRRQELILDAAAEGICWVDRDGLMVFANPAARRMFGLEDDDVSGVHFHERFHSRRPDGTAYPWEECPTYDALGGGPGRRVSNEVFFRADGSEFAVDYASAPVVEHDNVIGVVLSFTDVTERRAVERMKNEFVSVVSHELRTPLTSIRGSLGLLASGSLGPLSPDAQRMADIAVSNTDRLVRLVNDILDLERMESGNVELHRTAVPVSRLLRDAVASVSGLADESGVELRPAVVDGLVWVDSDRIIQALANLLSNAVNFSPPGEVVDIEARMRDDLLAVSVIDRGRGIPVDMQERIFDRFQQVDASDGRERGGSGLGLAIVKSIAVQHGGTVSVASVPGEGSTFTLSIPADREATGRTAGSGATRPRPVVLVVEDDADLAEVLAASLARRGIEAVATSTQAGAVTEAGRRRPDLIVLDVSLSEGDGYGVVEQLRRDRALDSTPVLVYTVDDLDSHARRRLLLGPTEFLTKASVPISAVEEKVLALLSASPGTATGRILLVDDDPDIQEVAILALERLGSYSVMVAGSGEDGLRMARAHQPDVILLDVMMPGLDGPSTLSRLRADPTTAAIPVVFLTAKAQTAERERLLRMDVAGILSKPFDAMTLADDVGRLMGWR